MNDQFSDGTPAVPVFDTHGRRLDQFAYPERVAKPEDTPADQIPHLLAHDSLGIVFSKFTDGRGFSLAARLKEFGYAGELHAMGEINQELMFLLSRVGFTHFHLPHDTQTLSPSVIRPFAAFYQGAADGSVPAWQMTEKRTEKQEAEQLDEQREEQTTEVRTRYRPAATVAHGAFA
jgi:hypothetical protein